MEFARKDVGSNRPIESFTAVLAGLVGLALTLSSVTPAGSTGFTLDGGSNYAILFDGNGGNMLQITNITVNGNVGVSGTGKMTDSGPSTINGQINFSASNTGQFSNNNASNVISGGVSYNDAAVGTALTALSTLNSTLSAEAGTPIAILGNTTINAGSGMIDGSGNSVFTVTVFNTTNSNVLTINGDGVHNVVLNFTSSTNFNNQVVLTGGLNGDQVLYNFVGGSNLTGGPTLQVNTNASSFPNSFAQGVFLDPNGAISLTNANILVRARLRG